MFTVLRVMNRWVFWGLLVSAALAESIFTTMPLVVAVLLVYYSLHQRYAVYLASWAAGVFLDVFSIRAIGLTSIFLFVFWGVVMLYERKFEIKTPQFVFLATFFGCALYLVSFGYEEVFVQSFISGVLGTALFIVLKSTIEAPREEKNL